MIILVTAEGIRNISSQAARLAIQSGRPGCPVQLALTAQALLDEGLQPREVAYVLQKLGE